MEARGDSVWVFKRSAAVTASTSFFCSFWKPRPPQIFGFHAPGHAAHVVNAGPPREAREQRVRPARGPPPPPEPRGSSTSHAVSTERTSRTCAGSAPPSEGPVCAPGKRRAGTRTTARPLPGRTLGGHLRGDPWARPNQDSSPGKAHKRTKVRTTEVSSQTTRTHDRPHTARRARRWGRPSPGTLAARVPTEVKTQPHTAQQGPPWTLSRAALWTCAVP